MTKTTWVAVGLTFGWILALAPLDALGALEPVPAAAAQYKAEKTIRGIFADEYRKDGPAARVALAVKLVAQGQQTEGDLPMRFVLFREARDLAAGTGNTAVAFQAIDETAKGFAVDPIDLKAAAFVTASLHCPADDMRALVDAGIELLDQAASADHFTATSRLGPVLETAARKTKEIPLLTKVQIRNREVADQKHEFDKQSAIFETLRKNPADPEANLAVGRYFCFVKGTWDSGLPMLAKGSDPALKDLATKELANPADAPAQLKLADCWWDLAKRQTGATKSQIERHTVAWYQKAWPGLTAVDKTRVEARLPKEAIPAPAAVVAAPTSQPATPVTTATPPPVIRPNVPLVASAPAAEPPSHMDAEGHRVVELTKWIDVDRGIEQDNWTRKGVEFTSHGGILAIPYDPPQEYDFLVEFTAADLPYIWQVLTHGGHQFRWEIWNVKGVGATFGFDGLQNGKSSSDKSNPSYVAKPAIVQPTIRHVSIVHVRNNSLSASLDGSLISQCTTDFSDVEARAARIYNGGLGLIVKNGPFTFHKIELVEISGKGSAIPIPPDDSQLVRAFTCAAPDHGQQPYRSVFLTADGRSVVSIGESVAVWDRTSGAPRLFWLGMPLNTAALSPDGRYVAATDRGGAQIAEIASPSRVAHLDGRFQHFMAFSPDSTKLATFGFGSNAIMVWSLHDLKNLKQAAPTSGIDIQRFSPGGLLLLCTRQSPPDVVSVWDARGLTKMWGVGLPYFDGCILASFSHDGARIVAGSTSDIHVLNTADGRVLASCRGHGSVAEPKFSPDGKLILGIWHAGGPVAVYDSATGDELDRFKDSAPSPVVSADWSPDGKRILIGCKTGVMVLLDLETGKPLQTFTGHVGPVWAVCFSADGKFVASSCNDNKVRLFRVTAK